MAKLILGAQLDVTAQYSDDVLVIIVFDVLPSGHGPLTPKYVWSLLFFPSFSGGALNLPAGT